MRTLPPRSKAISRVLALLASLSAATGCVEGEAPEPLAVTTAGEGPVIRFDLDTRPLPEVPFPNDLATRLDPTSPTGRRVNLSLEAPTEAERTLRTLAGTLDGFGTWAAISVAFDAPLDLQRVSGRGRPFEDDPVLVLDVTEGEHFGERFNVDLGRGWFPLVLPRLNAYFDHDPRGNGSNLLLESEDEDTDGDGRLDPGEDTDGDGVLDAPNVARPGDDPNTDLLGFWERETNTLLVRTVQPLRPARTYAVVLLKSLVGENGAPVRSPFEGIHHLRQREALARLPEALEGQGVAVGDVAFAWTFTTQSTVRELAALRQGLDGEGPFAALAERFPRTVTGLDPILDPGQEKDVLLRGEQLDRAFSVIAPAFVGGSPEIASTFAATFDNVDYIVGGRFETPWLLGDDDDEAVSGLDAYTGDEDELFRIDATTGEMKVDSASVPFWCVVPKPRPGVQAPFPVVFFAHGFGGTRLHSLGVAGSLARWGLATCAIDAVGCGQPITGDFRTQLDTILGALGMRPFLAMLEGFRARDLTNDGVPDSAADTFTTDALHTRDVVRQSALDWMRFIHIVRGFDGRRTWNMPGALGSLAGDFDGDGQVDLGGPDVDLHMTGISYGGIMTGIVAGVAPELTSALTISGGGGLSDIGMRSTQVGVPEAAMLRGMGPLLVGDPAASGRTRVRFVVTDGTSARSVEVADLPAVSEGDRLRLWNLRTGEFADALAGEGGRFRVAVAADALSATALRKLFNLEPWRADFVPLRIDETRGIGDPLRLEVRGPEDDTLRAALEHVDRDVTFRGLTWARGTRLVAPVQGWGLLRQTPRMRRFVQITQTLLEPTDPINYARHILAEPLPGASPKRYLSIVTLGDTDVPIATGLAQARAAGLVSDDAMETLVNAGVVTGVSRLGPLTDVDDLSDGTNGFDIPRLDVPLRVTLKNADGTESGLRIPVIEPGGAHGFAWPRPDRAFDVERYLANLMGQFFVDGKVTHRACLESNDCPDMPPAP